MTFKFLCRFKHKYSQWFILNDDLLEYAVVDDKEYSGFKCVRECLRCGRSESDLKYIPRGLEDKFRDHLKRGLIE